MTREIKFRAWDFTHKRMLYDGVCVFYPSYPKEIKGGVSLSGQVHLDPEENYHIIPLMNHKTMQYTGLKDKNGKEIYEGDILSFHAFVNSGGMGGYSESDFEGKGVIEYRPDGMTYVIHGRGSHINETMDWLLEDTTHFETGESIEVIGNIYENPELLEAK